MPDSIADWPSRVFYNGMLQTGTHFIRPPRDFPWPGGKHTTFIHCDSIEKQIESSYENEGEAKIIFSIVQKVIYSGDITAKEIGIVRTG